MIRHRRFRHMISRREELTLPEERALQAHLAQCAPCRVVAEDYGRHAAALAPLRQCPVRPAILDASRSAPARARLGIRGPRLPTRAPLAAVVGAVVILSTLSGGAVASSSLHWFQGGYLAPATASVKYYCVVGNSQSGGYSAYVSAVPGRACFTSRAAADRAIGLDPRALQQIYRSAAKEQGPPGSTFDDGSLPGHRCTASLPPQASTGNQEETAFVRCADGRIAIAKYSPSAGASR